MGLKNLDIKRSYISYGDDSWKLAELMKSGRSIVQRSPFISWEACG